MATYRHFESKEALFAAIASDGFIELRGEIDAVVAAHPHDPLKQLEEVGNRYIRLALRKPEHLRIMFGSFIPNHDDFDDLEKCGDSAFEGLVEVVKRCQAAGLFPEGDPLAKAIASWSIVHGFAMLLINGNLDFLGITLKNYETFGAFVARSIIHGLVAPEDKSALPLLKD